MDRFYKTWIKIKESRFESKLYGEFYVSVFFSFVVLVVNEQSFAVLLFG